MTAQQVNLITDRSRLRMERLRLEELEQQRWEQDALVMPEVCIYLSCTTSQRLTARLGTQSGLNNVICVGQDGIQRP